MGVRRWNLAVFFFVRTTTAASPTRRAVETVAPRAAVSIPTVGGATTIGPAAAAATTSNDLVRCAGVDIGRASPGPCLAVAAFQLARMWCNG